MSDEPPKVFMWPLLHIHKQRDNLRWAQDYRSLRSQFEANRVIKLEGMKTIGDDEGLSGSMEELPSCYRITSCPHPLPSIPGARVSRVEPAVGCGDANAMTYTTRHTTQWNTALFESQVKQWPIILALFNSIMAWRHRPK
jgi:hypothetical protein